MTQLASINHSTASGVVGDELPRGAELCNGQYVVEKYLNCGGFGITYLARDSLGRRVVIKECFPNAICCRAGETVRLRSRSYELDFDRAVDLFQKEAKALARLEHPNIVGVHQIFEANGTAYMALDFVEGTDLLDLLETHPEVRSPAALRELTIILLQALSYVHDNGILHRDISPDNILLDMGGTPVLIDFGAARQSATQASRILSRVYTVKDGYSPQEFYFAGSAQSPASDLYALAATLFHLVTGAPPPNSSLRLAAVAEGGDDPYEPLSGRYPAHDETLLAAIDRCMSLFAKERLSTARDWLNVITGEAALMDAEAEISGDINAEIAAMVEENNKVICNSVAAAPRAPMPKIKTFGLPQLEPEKDAAYWAALNEDLAACSADEKEEPEQVSAKVETPEHRRSGLFAGLIALFSRGSGQHFESNA